MLGYSIDVVAVSHWFALHPQSQVLQRIEDLIGVRYELEVREVPAFVQVGLIYEMPATGKPHMIFDVVSKTRTFSKRVFVFSES